MIFKGEEEKKKGIGKLKLKICFILGGNFMICHLKVTPSRITG